MQEKESNNDLSTYFFLFKYLPNLLHKEFERFMILQTNKEKHCEMMKEMIKKDNRLWRKFTTELNHSLHHYDKVPKAYIVEENDDNFKKWKKTNAPDPVEVGKEEKDILEEVERLLKRPTKDDLKNKTDLLKKYAKLKKKISEKNREQWKEKKERLKKEREK